MISGLTVTVEAAFGHGVLDGSPTWTDISSYFRSFTTQRGRSSIVGRFDPGTASILLDNRDGRFDPGNTAGAYWPDVVIGVPIRIQAEWDSTTYDVFRGTVEAWPLKYPRGNFDATVEVPLIDGFKQLASYDLNGQSFSQEATDSRIDNVLDLIGWPAGLRDLDTGVGSVQAVTFDGETSALSHLLDVAEAEVGSLFMGPDGQVEFRNRIASSGGSSSVATFDGSDYSEIEVEYNDDYYWNVVNITREGGQLQTAVNQTSLDDDNAEVTLSRTGTPNADDAQALNVAEWLIALYGDMRVRIRGLELRPQRDPSTLFPQVLGREIRDVVTVQLDPPGSGDSLNQPVAIEAIQHTVGVDSWTTRWTLAPLSDLEQEDFWVLGTSQLDTETILA